MVEFTVRTWSDDDAARNPKTPIHVGRRSAAIQLRVWSNALSPYDELAYPNGLSVIDRLTMGGLQTGRFTEANLEIRRATNPANVRTTGIRLMNALVEGTTEAATLYAQQRRPWRIAAATGEPINRLILTCNVWFLSSSKRIKSLCLCWKSGRKCGRGVVASRNTSSRNLSIKASLVGACVASGSIAGASPPRPARGEAIVSFDELAREHFSEATVPKPS